MTITAKELVNRIYNEITDLTKERQYTFVDPYCITSSKIAQIGHVLDKECHRECDKKTHLGIVGITNRIHDEVADAVRARGIKTSFLDPDCLQVSVIEQIQLLLEILLRDERQSSEACQQ